VDHSALRLRVESRVSTMLRLVGRLGGAQLARSFALSAVLTSTHRVVRGVLGYYVYSGVLRHSLFSPLVASAT
jgi:hypothetical protein